MRQKHGAAQANTTEFSRRFNAYVSATERKQPPQAYVDAFRKYQRVSDRALSARGGWASNSVGGAPARTAEEEQRNLHQFFDEIDGMMTREETFLMQDFMDRAYPPSIVF